MKLDIAEHLEKWGCDNVVTKAAVYDLLKILGFDVKNGKLDTTTNTSYSAKKLET